MLLRRASLFVALLAALLFVVAALQRDVHGAELSSSSGAYDEDDEDEDDGGSSSDGYYYYDDDDGSNDDDDASAGDTSADDDDDQQSDDDDDATDDFAVDINDQLLLAQSYGLVCELDWTTFPVGPLVDGGILPVGGIEVVRHAGNPSGTAGQAIQGVNVVAPTAPGAFLLQRGLCLQPQAGGGNALEVVDHFVNGGTFKTAATQVAGNLYVIKLSDAVHMLRIELSIALSDTADPGSISISTAFRGGNIVTKTIGYRQPANGYVFSITVGSLDGRPFDEVAIAPADGDFLCIGKLGLPCLETHVHLDGHFSVGDVSSVDSSD